MVSCIRDASSDKRKVQRLQLCNAEWCKIVVPDIGIMECVRKGVMQQLSLRE